MIKNKKQTKRKNEVENKKSIITNNDPEKITSDLPPIIILSKEELFAKELDEKIMEIHSLALDNEKLDVALNSLKLLADIHGLKQKVKTTISESGKTTEVENEAVVFNPFK